MLYVGVDAHSKASWITIMDEKGKILKREDHDIMRKQRSIRHTANVRGAVRMVLLLFTVACCLIHVGRAAADAPIGWAVVSGKGVESTTGGGNGKVVVAREQSRNWPTTPNAASR